MIKPLQPIKPTKLTLLLLLSIFSLSEVLGQSGFTFDFDGRIQLSPYQYDYPDGNKVTIEIAPDLLLEGRNSLGPDSELLYRLGGNLLYSRYDKFQGNLSDIAIELHIGQDQPTSFDLILGRQIFSDPIGNILSQGLDGINATLLVDDTFEAHVGVGYLGLFPASYSNAQLSDDEVENPTEWGSAPDRLFVIGDASFFPAPTVSLGLHGGLQIDLQENASTYDYTSWYVGIDSVGILVPDAPPDLEYRAQVSLGAGPSNEDMAAAPGIFLSNYWSVLIPGTFSTGEVEIGADFASGEGDIGGFSAFSIVPQGEFFRGGLDEIFSLSWRVGWNPLINLDDSIWLRNTNIYLSGKHFWNTSESARTISRQQTAGGEDFGHELSIGFSTSLLSDFTIEGIIGGLFKGTEDVRWFSKITLSLLF